MKKSQSVPFQEVPFSAKNKKKIKIRAVLITLKLKLYAPTWVLL